MRQGMARQVGYLQTRYKSIIKPAGDVLGIYLVNEGVLQGAVALRRLVRRTI